MAAYISSLRGVSTTEKFQSFDELVSGQSPNPATEQPMSIKQHDDPTFEISEGKMGFAWYIISFNNDQVDVDHYTHGQRDFSKSYSKAELVDEFGNSKSQINEAIQRIQQNQASNDTGNEDDED